MRTPDPANTGTPSEAVMSRQQRILVPMPGYSDPSNPMAQSGSINQSFDVHPVEHSEDFGGAYAPNRLMTDGPRDGMDEGAAEQKALAPPSDLDRDEWTLDNWRTQAVAYDLSKVGNKGEVRNRVEQYENDNNL